MKIEVKGVICSNDDKPIYDLFNIESTSPNVISEAIDNADGEDVEVIINSGGGDLFSGSEIFSELKEYTGNVEAKITGVAASAASIIAMGADKVTMSPTASLMIHNVSLVTSGDHNDMQHASNTLKTLNKTVANAYMDKTGMTQDELLGLMENETWLEANEAKEKGFIDEVLFQETKAVASSGNVIPQKVIDGVRNTIMEQKLRNEDDESTEKEESKEESSGGLSSKQKQEVRDIVKDEIKKQTGKKEEPKENKLKNNFKRWL